MNYKTLVVGWAKQHVPISLMMGTASEAFAHPTLNDNYLLIHKAWHLIDKFQSL